MFKSLRWRLQVWHAIVLLVVLTSFGGIVHNLHWQTRLQQIDAELDRTSGAVLSQMRRLLPMSRFWPGGRRARRPENSRPGDSRPDRPRPDFARPDGARPDGSSPENEIGQRTQANVAAVPAPPEMPRDEASTETPARFPSPGPPPPRRDRSFGDPGPLPEEFQQLFQGDEESRLYFAIWNAEGELLQSSESAPVIDYPNLHIGKDGLPIRTVRSRLGGHIYREVIHAGMFDMNLLVGRSLERDLAAHHRSGLLLAASGLVILAAGVLGGGWLSSRAIRPIAEMTATAESISAQNFSERINAKDTDSELGKLATVLNGTFDRLQAAFERQSQFTADASHELRTPLSVITTHTELALSRPRSNEEYRGTIETCQRASLRMKSLIDSLLVLARFDSGVQSLKTDRLDLGPLIRDCVELVEPLASDRNVDIEYHMASCYVAGDRDRLSQVVTNLLTNAIRYNVEGGHVSVASRTDSGTAFISVTDTGIGIDGDQLSRIFDRFYQVDKARSRAEGSSGLGLSICKTIVEAHGGTIAATSSPGKGTTIEVRIEAVV